MRARLPLVLATIAALLGAPSLASAAGNALGAPSVSPTSGTSTTVFTLRVGYEGKFPASSVSVSVAGLSLPMARMGGAPAQGTWSVSTLLPAGTWTPTFTSSAERGNTSILIGPTITVSGPAIPVLTPTPTGTAGPPGGDPEMDEGPVGTQDPGTTDPGTTPVEDGPEVEPSGDAEPIASPSADPSPGTDAGRETPRAGGSPGSPTAPAADVPRAGGEGEDPAAARADAPEAERSEVPAAAAEPGRSDGEEAVTAVVDNRLLAAVLLLGLSGVAAVAVIGTALLILGRRRASEEEVPVVVPLQSETDALLERRTVRRAKVRLTDDPIVAAMGVEDQVAARRQRRRAAQATSGPGERPTRPKR